MRVALLLNRRRARLRTAAKQWVSRAYGLLAAESGGRVMPPEYDSFGMLGDEPPVVFGTGDPIPWDALRACHVLLWEWGWTASAAQVVIEIHRRHPIPTVVFPGPIDRFWAELNPATLPLHREAARLTTGVGVMSRDTIGFYQALMPWAHVCHLPVPLDAAFFSQYAPEDELRDPNLILLTAPTRFVGRANDLPIASLAAFLHLRSRRPDVRGVCFAYSREEAATASVVIDAFGLGEAIVVERFRRPIQRYLTCIARCGAGLFLPRADIQGRTAMIAAATGLPMVLSDDVDAHRTLFPHTTTRWTDACAAGDMCFRLLADADFRSLVGHTAAAAVSYYGVEPCRDRLASIVAMRAPV